MTDLSQLTNTDPFAPTQTTTTPKATKSKKPLTPEQKRQAAIDAEIKALSQSLGLSGLVGSGGQLNLVPNSEAAATIPLATSAHGWLVPDKGAKMTGNTYTTSYADLLVSLIRESGRGNGIVEQLQKDMQGIGALSQTYVISDKVTPEFLKSFEKLAKMAGASGVPLATLLSSGSSQQAQQLMAQEYAYTKDINSALLSAVGGTVTTQPLDDPNYIRQQFASAMESMGMGTPSPQVSDQFVNAFLNGPQGQIAARQNEANVQKEDQMAVVQRLRQAREAVASGNPKAGAALVNQPGPTFVATRASPNLDAEAMAAAKNVDPAEYYATGASYLGGLLNQMVSGAPQYQTRAETPSASAPAGGILGTPIAGAP